MQATGAAWLPGATPEGSIILKAVTEALCPRDLIDNWQVSVSPLWEVTGRGQCAQVGLSEGYGR